MLPYFMRKNIRETFITNDITESKTIISTLQSIEEVFDTTITILFNLIQFQKISGYRTQQQDQKAVILSSVRHNLYESSTTTSGNENYFIKEFDCNFSKSLISITKNSKNNYEQFYHCHHHQLKGKFLIDYFGIISSLSSINLQRLLSLKNLIRGMLASTINFKSVNGSKSNYNENMKEQQKHYQSKINAVDKMIKTMKLTETTTPTTPTTATMMSVKSFYQNITNSNTFYTDFDMNFTPSVSEVLLEPTTSSVISPAVAAATTKSSISSSTIIEASSGIIITTMNTSDSGTTDTNNGTDDGLNSFYFYETEQFAVLWILFIVIVLGNSAVLVTLFMNKNRKSRMNFFIKQLAIADLFVGLLNVLTDIIWRITVSWRAGNIACKLIRFLQVCVTYASTYVLVALSIDRYDAITHPMNFSGSWQRARRLVACAWVVSAFFSAPMLFLYEEKSIQGQTQCWIELGKPWRWQLYMSLVSATLFFFPALIITTCYAIIVRTIWVKGSVFIPAERGRGCGNLASRRASSRGIIPRAKVKTVKMTFVIVIVFVVCWSPYIIFDLLQVFGQIPRTQTNIAIATFIQSLAPLNSAANPLIYCLFSTQVCRALKRIPPFRWIPWSCCCCCCYCCGINSQGRNSAPIRCTTVGQRLHNSCDSMRTLTTSLTMSRRSNNNCMRPARVVIVERPKTILAMSEV